MKNSFEFLTNSNCLVKNGSTIHLPEILINKNFSDPLFFIDEGFYNSSTWKKYHNKFKKYFKIKKIIISGKNEPTYNSLNYYLKKTKKFYFKTIVAIGGGSCMDTAKAIAALIKNKKKPLYYRGFNKLNKKGCPIICIPTTAGTGSEASYNASFVDEIEKKKMGINGKFMFADFSILDAVNTVTCPKFSAIGAALDAFVHSIEGYTCNKSNIFSDILAEKSISLISNSILDLTKSRPNLHKRLDLLIAAHLSGIVQMNSGSGIASAISYPLSVYYKVPHGIGGGIFVLDIIKYNINNGYNRYKNLSKILNLKNSKDPKSFLNYFIKIFDKLKVPKKLSYFGLSLKNLNFILKIMRTQQKAFDQNPIKMNIKSKTFKNLIVKYL